MRYFKSRWNPRSALAGTYTWSAKYTSADQNNNDASDQGGRDEQTVALANAQIVATGLAWNPIRGGISISYSVQGGDLTTDSTIKFYWVGGDQPVELPELQLALKVGSGLDTQGNHGPLARPNITTLPPPGATGLKMVIDEGGSTKERTIDYQPSFDINAKFNGESSPGVIGRFFSGPDVTGENATFKLPDSLAALNPTSIEATLGSNPLTVSSTGGSSYKTSDFNPGSLDTSTDLVITVKKGTAVLDTERATVEVVRLPDWFKNMLTQNPVGFDPATGTYTLSGYFLNVKTGNLFPLPLPKEGIWFGGGVSSGLDAQAFVKVTTGLDPTQDPQVLATLDINLVFLGDSVYTQHYVSVNGQGSADGGKFTFKADLDPKTLQLTGATLSYHENGSGPVDVLKGRQFAKGFYRATSAVQADLTYDLKLSLSLDTTGAIQNSQLAFDLGGTLSGNLTDVQITSNSAALRILELVKRANPHSQLLTNLISALQNLGILPSFDIKAPVTGSFSLKGRATLVSNSSARKDSFHGAFDMALTAQIFMTYLGEEEEIAGLPKVVNDTLNVHYPF